VAGTFVREGGRVSQNPPAAQSAIYDGSLRADTMTLRLRVVDGNEPLSTFTLTRDAAGRLLKCLQPGKAALVSEPSI